MQLHFLVCQGSHFIIFDLLIAILNLGQFIGFVLGPETGLCGADIFVPQILLLVNLLNLLFKVFEDCGALHRVIEFGNHSVVLIIKCLALLGGQEIIHGAMLLAQKLG
jgi:hypothetical protein